MSVNYAIGFEEVKTQAELNETELVPIAAESPVALKFDAEGRVVKVTYCDEDLKDSGQPAFSWSEEILRDENGKVFGVKTLRPSGAIVVEQFVFDSNGKFIGSKLVRDGSNVTGGAIGTPDNSGGSGSGNTGGEEEEEEEEEEE